MGVLFWMVLGKAGLRPRGPGGAGCEHWMGELVGALLRTSWGRKENGVVGGGGCEEVGAGGWAQSTLTSHGSCPSESGSRWGPPAPLPAAMSWVWCPPQHEAGEECGTGDGVGGGG